MAPPSSYSIKHIILSWFRQRDNLSASAKVAPVQPCGGRPGPDQGGNRANVGLDSQLNCGQSKIGFTSKQSSLLLLDSWFGNVSSEIPGLGLGRGFFVFSSSIFRDFG